jgi:hypothetical protein
MRRHRRLVAALAIAIIAVAACLPGLAGIDFAVFELPWTLVPEPEPLSVPVLASCPDEQSPALRSLLPSRAPPPSPAA